MFLDKLTTFADDLALPTSAPATTAIGDVYDQGHPKPQNRDVGHGNHLYWEIFLKENAAGAGATVKVELVSSDSADLSSPTVHDASPEWTIAQLTGPRRVLARRLPDEDYKRYIGIQVTVGTAALTAGKITSHISLDAYSHKTYEGEKSYVT